jgi:hypothetical protein
MEREKYWLLIDINCIPGAEEEAAFRKGVFSSISIPEGQALQLVSEGRCPNL